MVRELLKAYVYGQMQKWHKKRFATFLNVLRQSTFKVRSIVDLGGGNGEYMASCAHRLPGIKIIIADIDTSKLYEAYARYGFEIVKLLEQGLLALGNKECDFVFCNSVIEHVTVSKKYVWEIRKIEFFRKLAREHQKFFASEILRISKGYFVQTPHRIFPIESHTWLPLVGYLPRPLLISLLKSLNRWWLKTTIPDWCLLDYKEMEAMFPGAVIITEKVWGIPKSIIAFSIK